jgi:hypothetical protein
VVQEGIGAKRKAAAHSMRVYEGISESREIQDLLAVL